MQSVNTLPVVPCFEGVSCEHAIEMFTLVMKIRPPPDELPAGIKTSIRDVQGNQQMSKSKTNEQSATLGTREDREAIDRVAAMFNRAFAPKGIPRKIRRAMRREALAAQKGTTPPPAHA